MVSFFINFNDYNEGCHSVGLRVLEFDFLGSPGLGCIVGVPRFKLAVINSVSFYNLDSTSLL